MNWRLGLDIGSTSIGWAVVGLDIDGNPKSVDYAGVRKFDESRDPKAKRSLAEQRREPRGARRNRDRYKKRRQEFMAKLIKHGLMPEDKETRKALENKRKGQAHSYETDPWVLRVKGLDEKLHIYEFGRALFHLQQRRGFKSNRKTDKTTNEKGAIHQASLKTQALIAETGAKTYGQALAMERVANPSEAHNHPVRARPTVAGTKVSYEIYPLRAMIEDEFSKLWQAQQQFHGSAVLTDAMRDDLADTLLFQRPLKAQPIGKCTLIPTEQRAPACLPSTQLLRIYQEVNNLRVLQAGEAARPLTIDERNKLIEKLMTTGEPAFTTLGKLIALPLDAYFNLESEKRKKLKGDVVGNILKGETYWGPGWLELSLSQQDAIVEILNGCEATLPNKKPNPVFETLTETISAELGLSIEVSAKLLQATSDEEIARWLEKQFELSAEQAFNVANAPTNSKWPQGHGRLGRSAGKRILNWLASDETSASDPETGEVYEAPFVYSEAVALAGLGSHSDLDKHQTLDRLPYYGRVLERQVAFGTGDPNDKDEKRLGKIANPTVHVALNQLRRVVNELIKTYGKPERIIVETARDLPLSAEGRKELEKEQKDNQANNEKIDAILAKEGIQGNYENRMKYRLWEELDPDNIIGRCCPYSGDVIGIEKLFSSEVEIEHILPYAQTGDDSRANKTLSTKKANNAKGNESPYEAFGKKTQKGYDWPEIVARSLKLPKNKRWRFNPDAMERFADETAFVDRHITDTSQENQLNNTRYINRITALYLKSLGCDVWVTPGKLTAQLRHLWGLNSILAGHNKAETQTGDAEKNRNDHRHHAIDAIVVALTDRGLLNTVSRRAALGWDEGKNALNLLNGLGQPWDNFRDEVRGVVEKIVVSHKPDHGLQGGLHEAYAYGVVTDQSTGEHRLAKRKLIQDLSYAEIDKIGDDKIKRDLQILVAPLVNEKRKPLLPKKEAQQELLNILSGYSLETGVKRVRVHYKEKHYIQLNHGQNHYKALIPGENLCVDLIELPDGDWNGVGVSRFEANKLKRQNKPIETWRKQYPDGKFVMRVFKNDIISTDQNGLKYWLVKRLAPSNNNFYLVEIHEGGSLEKRHEDRDDHFRWNFTKYNGLKSQGAKLVRINPLGQVFHA